MYEKNDETNNLLQLPTIFIWINKIDRNAIASGSIMFPDLSTFMLNGKSN